MISSVIALAWLLILFGTPWRDTQGFVPLCRQLSSLHPLPIRNSLVGDGNRPTPSTTALYRSKTIICQVIGVNFERKVTSSEALRDFMNENRIFYLVDHTSSPPRPIGRSDFAALRNGTSYTVVTFAQYLIESCRMGNGLGWQGSSSSLLKGARFIVGELLAAASNVPYTPNLTRRFPAPRIAIKSSVIQAEDDRQGQSPNRSRVKEIYYVDTEGMRFGAVISGESSYKNFRETMGIPSLFNEYGMQIFDYDNLQDGATYTLGRKPVELVPHKRSTFDHSTLRRPEEVVLPAICSTEPQFVCEPGWLEAAVDTLIMEFNASDASRPAKRVRPMALLSSSRTGKTRSMQEIAHKVRRVMSDQQVAVIFITFNQYSAILPAEENDPKQALFQRLMFEAQAERTAEDDRFVTYKRFRKMAYTFHDQEVTDWLGETKIILFVDELNNLKSATTLGTAKARDIGDFVRENFLSLAGSYFVFSSQKLTTKNVFVDIIDSSEGSSRTAILQMLPMSPNVTEAKDKLNLDLLGSREAIFDGLLPAMIYSRTN